MKHLILSLTLLLGSMPVYAQQVTEFEECTRTREVYIPGYYDRYGNYQQGRVNIEKYRVPCGGYVVERPVYREAPPPVYTRPRTVQCDPTKTALGGVLGGGVAASMSRGNAYKWSVPLGAFIGGVAFGCNN